MEIEAKYDLTAKAKASAQNAMNTVRACARWRCAAPPLHAQASRADAGGAGAQARELEEKHQVSAKVGSALGKGLDRLSAMLGARPAAGRAHVQAA